MDTPHEEAKLYKIGLLVAVVVLSSTLSLTLNIVHALVWHNATPADTEMAGIVDALGKAGLVTLGLFHGVIPVAFALMLSKVIGTPLATSRVQGVIVTLFVIGMAMSFYAQFQLLSLLGVGPFAVGVPLILDVSDLVALNLIAKAHRLNKLAALATDRAAEIAALKADIEADIRPVVEADTRRTYEADIARAVADKEADIRADMEADMRRTSATREADMEREYEERLAAARAGLEAGYNERLAASEDVLREELEVEIAARYRREVATKTRPNGKSPAKKAEASPSASDAPASKDTLLALLKRQPGLTVKDQATSLGVTDRTIRRWREQLAEEGFALADIVQLRAAN